MTEALTSAPTTSITRAATVSTVSQLVGKAVHLVLNVVSSLAILRYLAPGAYGSYVLIVTVVTLVGVVADFGLPRLAVREISRATQDPGRAQDEILGTIVALRLGLAVVAVLGCQGVLALLDASVVVHQAAAVASCVMFADAVLSMVVVSFQVHLLQQYEAIVRVLAEALETALVLVIIACQLPLIWLFGPPVLGVVVGAALALVLARRRLQLRLRPVRSRVRYLMTEALPLGPALLISIIYIKLDSLVLAAMRPSRDVGIYGAGYQPVEYLFLATSVIINVLFPILARQWARQDRGAFLAMYRRGTELLVIVTAFVPLLFVFVAPDVVRLAYGSAYAESAVPLQILSVALITMTVSVWQAVVLLTGGLQRLTLIYNAAALVFALGLCTLLVWRIGLVGAAVSALATSCLVVITSMTLVRRRMGLAPQPARLLRIVVAVAATAAVLAVLQHVGAPWFLLVAAACVVYAGVLHRFGFHRTIREAFV